MLGWAERDWISFCKDVCTHYNVQHNIFKYFVLEEPQTHYCKQEEEAEDHEGKAVQRAIRLARVFEEQSEWLFDRHSLAVELAGDSQVVINWLLGVWQTFNHVCSNTLHGAQHELYELTDIANMRPPNAGHNVITWVYCEGNERADELTWEARRGNTGKYTNMTSFRRSVINTSAYMLSVVLWTEGGPKWVLDVVGLLTCMLIIFPHPSHLLPS
jgi:hypothetical protein